MKEEHALYGCLFLIVLAIIGIIILLIMIGDPFAEQCAAAGNTLLTDTDTNVGFDTDFNVVFVSETDRVCVTPDGRIVDID